MFHVWRNWLLKLEKEFFGRIGDYSHRPTDFSLKINQFFVMKCITFRYFSATIFSIPIGFHYMFIAIIINIGMQKDY